MAYMDSFGQFTGAVQAVEERGFSALEWNVIALARRDGLGSLGEPGRLARAMRGLFGLGARSRLADPRLEALRRLAVHAWAHDYALPQAEVDAFVAAGFTMGQVERLVASVVAARAEPQMPAVAIA